MHTATGWVRGLNCGGVRIERLDARRLLAADVTNGILAIVSTASRDYIDVSLASAGTLSVSVNRVVQSFSIDSFSAIELRSGSGSDVITIGDLKLNPSVRLSIDAGAGNDHVIGSPAAELIKGGTGNDLIEAGDGRDTVNGGDGNDSIECDAGNDLADGAAGSDTILGDRGNDTLRGGLGDDNLNGQRDDDLLYGDDGSDRLQDGKGAASMYGGAGDDFIAFVFERKGDRITGGIGDGGDGRDTLTVPQAYLVEQFNGLNGLNGSSGDVSLFGGAGDDVLAGGNVSGDDGNDSIEAYAVNAVRVHGGKGDDRIRSQSNDYVSTIDGEEGNDDIQGFGGLLAGGPGDDRIAVGGDRQPTSKPVAVEPNLSKYPRLEGGDGNDRLYGNSYPERLVGGLGDDVIYGSYGNDTVNGNDGNDLIYGEGDDDSLSGDAGSDTLYGGSGDDNLFGGLNLDRLFGGDDGKDKTRSDDGIDFGDTGSQKGDWRDPRHPWRAIAYEVPPNSNKVRNSGGTDIVSGLDYINFN